MSDEQPDDEERKDLNALLNRHVPANPGKPRPWVPSDSASYAAQGNATAGDAPAGAAEAAPTANENEAPQGQREPRWPPAPPAAPAPPASNASAAAMPSGERHGLADLSALVADVGRITSRLQGQLTELQGTIESAKEQSYEAASADEAVTVTVDGRPRATRVYVDPKAVRGGPEALGARVVEAVNSATNAARAGAQRALLDGLDPQLRAAIGAEIENAAANATSDDGAGAARPQGGRHG